MRTGQTKVHKLSVLAIAVHESGNIALKILLLFALVKKLTVIGELPEFVQGH